MLRQMCKSKIHRATVTQADLNYVGSITIDETLLKAAGVVPYEMVQITNLANGVIWHTYAIAGEAGSGEICLNGPPARHFQPGDLVIILSKGLYADEALAEFKPTVLFVDELNQITEIRRDEAPFESWVGPLS